MHPTLDFTFLYAYEKENYLLNGHVKERDDQKTPERNKKREDFYSAGKGGGKVASIKEERQNVIGN